MEKNPKLNAVKSNDSFNARWEAAKKTDEAIRRRRLGLEPAPAEKAIFPALEKQAEKALHTGVTLAAAAAMAVTPVAVEAEQEAAVFSGARPAVTMTVSSIPSAETELPVLDMEDEDRKKAEQREDRLLTAARTLLTAAGALFSLLLRMLSGLVPLMRTGVIRQLLGGILPLLCAVSALFVFLCALYFCFFPGASIKALWTRKNWILFGGLSLIWRILEGLFALTGQPFVQGLLGWALDGFILLLGWWLILSPLVDSPALPERLKRILPWVLAIEGLALILRIVGMYQGASPLPGGGLALLLSALALGLFLYVPRTTGSLLFTRMFTKTGSEV